MIRIIQICILTGFIGLSLGAKALDLCEPLSTSKNRDELGGVFDERLLTNYEHKLTLYPQLGWVELKDSTDYPDNSCTKIAFSPKSTVYTYKNRFGHRMLDFIHALRLEKSHIMSFYKSEAGDQNIEISDSTYNRLAYLSIGILGAESSSGQSLVYYAEHLLSHSSFLESFAYCLINFSVRACTTTHITSRGPTQIKQIPKIGELYGITRNNLSNPYLAGIATMGFLIETYKWYLNLIKNGSYSFHWEPGSQEAQAVTENEFDIFLTYMYRGDTVQIRTGSATPNKNCYLKRVLKFQEYIKMYVHPEKSCESPGASLLDSES